MAEKPYAELPTPDRTLQLASEEEFLDAVETWVFHDGPLIYTAQGAGREWLVLWVDQVDVVTPISAEWPHAHYTFVYVAAPLDPSTRAALADGTLRFRAFWEEAAARGHIAIIREGRERGVTRLAGPMPQAWLPTPDADCREYMPEACEDHA